jgi:hypothetical protein
MLELDVDHKDKVVIYKCDGFNPINLSDGLQHCLISEADAIFIMNDKTCDDPAVQDTRTILLTMAAKKTLMKLAPHRLWSPSTPNGCRVLSQVLRSEDKRHVRLAGADEVLCINELQARMLAQTALCRGILPIISNLTRSLQRMAQVSIHHGPSCGRRNTRF